MLELTAGLRVVLLVRSLPPSADEHDVIFLFDYFIIKELPAPKSSITSTI